MPSTTVDPAFVSYRQAAAYLKSRLEQNDTPSPVVGIICGSGLSGLSKTLIDTLTIPFGEIPGFPADCTVQGHKGELVFGSLAGSVSVSSVCLRGRFHSYEGYDMSVVALPVHVMRALGVKFLIVTNAAGGLDATYNVGDIVSVTDHFAIPMLAGKNPLIGPNDDELGPRFPPTSNAYDPKIQDVVVKAAKNLGFGFLRKDGLYCFVSGPMYESKAECKFLRSLGGSAVGMSTVPEIVAAHHCGMKVLCLSLITNKVVITGEEGPHASHEEVLDAVNKRADQMQSLVKEIVRLLSDSGHLANLPDLPSVNLTAKAEQTRGKRFTLCPYHILTSIPPHCVVMGAAVFAIGTYIFGATICKQKH